MFWTFKTIKQNLDNLTKQFDNVHNNKTMLGFYDNQTYLRCNLTKQFDNVHNNKTIYFYSTMSQWLSQIELRLSQLHKTANQYSKTIQQIQIN